jgi:uncharacterized protein YndB with AHSA1/START domain
MIERQTALPINAADLWEVLTDPALLSEWFGATIEWNLEPGGSMRAIDDQGITRDGIVVEVEAERHLQFQWWPSDEPDCVSEVTYTIEADDEGSVLTIIERPVFETVSAVSMLTVSAESWSVWDTRGLGIVDCSVSFSVDCSRVGAAAIRL